ncbi:MULTISPECIES: YheT family hydrolase [Caballeronia]|uniref:YheT family hydrolase n=1 Tax=Caballeronia TaxID=1827195 RepID=UPI00025BC99E|nr:MULTISPECIES: alpha/beta fold hydrolase [Caballeronia]EKS68645.1 putative hydrolase of the alpha/beta-hydrolase fold protein [Burkholderia sp. SJ98]MCG7399229.1 alpha/beta fold hydrolase [Caballeronia zhejiangensis]MCI1042264.1 alpha/beta fold hydrolase [Caballeronia zhejiangensis]
MKRDPLLKHDSSFVDKAPAVALKETARLLSPGAAEWLYSAPRWLPTSHAQTIVPALFGRKPDVRYRRERWNTPDGDFIDLDFLAHDPADQPAANAPLFVLFHGLEGSSDSHYARTMMAAARARGWHGVVPHFRSCSGPLNLLPRFYHLADSAEVDWILRRLAQVHRGPIVAAGVSLGGNVLLHWLCQRGTDASIISAAAAISAPLDVHAGGLAISQGFGMVYTRSFLKSLKKKALAKLGQYPGLYDRNAVLAARTLYEFDNVVTAPLHGFRDTNHYWSTATIRAHLKHIEVPALLLNARNDPFLPEFALPSTAEVSARVTLDQPNHGGHVGFMTGPFPGRIDWLSQRVFGYLENFVS